MQGFSLCALTGLLISPISWSHHWVLAIPALLLFALGTLRRSWLAGTAVALIAAGVAYSHMIWWVPIDHPEHSELHLDPLQLLYADAYVLLGLAVLAAAGSRLAIAARARPKARPSASSREHAFAPRPSE